MSLSLKDRLVYNIRSNKMKLRPEQTVKNKLISILDDIEEKVEEMQTVMHQVVQDIPLF